ncbi:acetyl-CoA synthetase-like protein [Ramaria rubella]|nr:acetyl-CoA synthetase-like protein [Ramaria rubella]
MDWLKTDDVTVLLAISFVAVYAVSKFLKPQSLVHPLLLGRQADVGRVRLPGESAIYRNYATGIMGRLPERPKPEIKLIGDLLQNDDKSRILWSTTITNSQLKERAEALGAGLLQVAKLLPRESTALLLLDDNLELLITDLALANHSIVSFTLTEISLLIPTLEKHAPTTIIIQQSFLEHILEHVADLRQSAHHTIIVLGDNKQTSDLHSQRSGIRILRWEDLENQGKIMLKPSTPSPGNTTLDLAGNFEPNDIINVSFFADTNGDLRGSQISHANIIAGVTAARLLFPVGEPISSSDTLLSMFSLRSAFGRSIIYTALYEGANIITRPAPLQFEDDSTPTSELSQLLQTCEGSAISPSILFLTPSQFKPLTSSILRAASSNPLFGLALRHKLSDLQEGFVTKVSFWDNLFLKGARTKSLGKLEATLRGIVVSGGRLETAAMEPARVAFSVPIVSAYSHPLVCGPVMASHPLDLQSFPGDSEPHFTVAHVGPPATNVEVKLVGVLDSSVEKGGDPTGDLLVRGPSVALALPAPVNSNTEGWVPMDQKARVQTNGTFKIL